ncbi:MAG: C4-dicarboxylate ABC transporter permease, partial [Caldimonas sp.]
FMFVLDPSGQGLLLMGSTKALAAANWLSIGQVTLTAALGIAAIAMGFQGWALRRAGWLERCLLVAAGLALTYPGVKSDLLGLALVVGVLARQRFMHLPAGLRPGA